MVMMQLERLAPFIALALIFSVSSAVAASRGHLGFRKRVVWVAPGDDIQAKVNANPRGTTFNFRPGTYRFQSIVPKAGNVFDGINRKAILSGARLLTGWTVSGATWFVTGQTQESARNQDGMCLAGFDRCAWPEDLFINNVPMRHVLTQGAVTTGTYFFDYAADTIYIGDNPAGQTIETSVTAFAFGGAGGGDVTIKNLTIEKYATQFQFSAVDSGLSGLGWIIRNNTIRWNHGQALNFTNGTIVVGNLIDKNGQMGYSGDGANWILDGNEIRDSGYSGVDYLWEGGGGKITTTTGGVIRNNCVHGNVGAGIWGDEDADGVTVDRNKVFDNTETGIMHEISEGTTISNNVVFNNGIAMQGGYWNPQILISSASGADVFGNTVDMPATYGNGITIVNQDRAPHTPAINNDVHNNVVTNRSANDGMSGATNDGLVGDDTAVYGQNSFHDNVYHVTDTAGEYWTWDGIDFRNFASMQSAGRETGSTIDTSLPTAPTSTCP